MRIFVMPTSYPSEDNPVANSFVKEQVKAIYPENSDIIVLNVRKQPSNRVFKKIDKSIHFINDGVSDVVYKNQKTFLESRLILLNQLLFNRAMKKVYNQAVKKYGKPDIVYAHFYNAGYVAVKLTKKDKIPVVVLEHSGLLINHKIDFRAKWILKYTVERASEYIVTTSSLQKYVKLHTGINKDFLIIPNIVDDCFVYSPPVKKDNFEFFSVSRFDYDKRIDLMIEAFCEAFAPSEDVFLTIGGSGKEFENISKLIEDKGRSEQIKLVGRMSRTEVLDSMIKCDSFVLPSRHETFGLVWREAMCVGRPVITTDHGGFSSEDWSDSYGIMIPVDDKGALSEALKTIKNNYNLYNLNKISKDNTGMYSSDKICKKILALFQDLVGANK